MSQIKHADIRWNNGIGALLCNSCSVVLRQGFNHEDKEHYCKDCQEARDSAKQKLKEAEKAGDNQWDVMYPGLWIEDDDSI